MFTKVIQFAMIQKGFTLLRFGWPMAKAAWELIEDGKLTRNEVHAVADFVVDNAMGDQDEIVLWLV